MKAHQYDMFTIPESTHWRVTGKKETGIYSGASAHADPFLRELEKRWMKWKIIRSDILGGQRIRQGSPIRLLIIRCACVAWFAMIPTQSRESFE